MDSVRTMETGGVAPPPPRTPRSRRNVRWWLLGALLSLVLVSSGSLLLEGSALRVDTARATEPVPLSLQLSVKAAVQREALVPAWAADLADASEVPEPERLHLSLLHAACISEQDAIIPWQHGAPGTSQDALLARLRSERSGEDASTLGAELIRQDDPDLLDKLRRCPDVDVFLPRGLRGNGYCEDAVAYAKYLDSRLLPLWVFEIKLFDASVGREVDYFDLCPTTPVLFFNHYWESLPASPRWPAGDRKPLYLMPNIEMYELNATHLWRADTVLCKTRACHDRVSQWYAQEGNPRATTVFYTKHTSSDQAALARRLLGNSSSNSSSSNMNSSADAVASKDFSRVRFVHTAGTSVWKGTRQVVDCWLKTPGLPQLDLFMDESAFDMLLGQRYAPRLRHSPHAINLTLGRLDARAFGQVVADAAFFLCPSVMEGYGHYINQARASGAVVVTTDVPPMNELVADGDTGVLVSARADTDPHALLGGGYQGEHGLQGGKDGGLVASFSSGSLCRSVKRLVSATTADERRAMAEAARRQYHADTKFFARAMAELRAFARAAVVD